MFSNILVDKRVKGHEKRSKYYKKYNRPRMDGV